MRTTRPSTSFFALVCAVALVGGSVGEPFNIVGCTHHEAIRLDAEGELSPHAGHADEPAAPVVDANGSQGLPDGDAHGPCLCIGACAGAGVVGVVMASGATVLLRAGDARPVSERLAIASAPAGRVPYLLPYPTAPPRLG